MKKLLSSVFLLIISFSHSFSQTLVSENRSVKPFNKVKVSSGIDLYLKQGNTERMVVTAPDDKMDKLITEVKDGVLLIYFERNNFSWGWNITGNNNSPKVVLSFKDLEGISASGGADVFSQGRLLFENISVSASGGSDLKLELTADAIECNSSGGSDVILIGSTKLFKGNASGGSDLKAKELRSQSATVNSSGGSDAYIWVEDQLSANASGGSDIYYYGTPKNVRKQSSGGSDITHK